MSPNKKATSAVVMFVAVLALISQVLLAGAPAEAASIIRVNTGGPSQVVDGVQWSGCASPTACNGWAKGGGGWTESPAWITGVVSPDSQTIEKSEWTWGRQNGVAYGGKAFGFDFPVDTGTYDVTLHFTENNKNAAGQRMFDVGINGTTKLAWFDIFQAAGGKHKTVTRTFRVPTVNGRVNVEFFARIENAKISAIQVIPVGGTTPTTPTTPTTATTTTTVAPQPQPQPGGTNIAWSNVAPSPHRSVESAGTALDGKLYTFGGYFPGSWLPVANSYAYDVAGNRWEQLPNAPRPITHSAIAVDGRNLVLAGGYTTNSSTQTFAINNVWRFNVDTRQWTNLPNLPQARGSGAMAVTGRTLHFVGGVDPGRVERGDHWTLNLDNTGEGWKTSAPFPNPRTHFALQTVGNSMYAIGGLFGVDAASYQLNGVFRFDTTTNRWTTETSLPAGRSHMTDSTFVHNNKIYVLGGELAYGKAANNVYVYDTNTRQWSQTTPLPWGRFSGVAGVVNGNVYFATGEHGSNAVWKGTFW